MIRSIADNEINIMETDWEEYAGVYKRGTHQAETILT